MFCLKQRPFLLNESDAGLPRWRVWIVVGLLAFMLSASLTAGAGDLAVIVNAKSGVEQLTKAEVINLFLGRQKRLPSGAAALTVDLAGPNAEKQQFYARLVNKQLAEINSYWARLFFSGQGSPPRQAEAPEEVLEIVENNQSAIGYVERTKVNSRVKIVYLLED
ncbi:MAG: hypothetical protein KDI50_06980 [Candidatus Competibacteraceae bacterium]|nr:hypothetical protein [Candidatus Competibacteraceae bacterium]